jgi:hypothetical protein
MKSKVQGRNGLSVRVSTVLAILVAVATTVGAQDTKATKPGSASDDAEYLALCREIPVSELTAHADEITGEHVTLTGQILVWEERDDEGVVTYLIIAVDDPSNVLPSGQLPVYVVYAGTIRSFIYDTISVYGEVYGNDVYESVALQAKTLPRIDARYVVE